MMRIRVELNKDHVMPAIVTGLLVVMMTTAPRVAAAEDRCQPHWDNTIGQPGMDLTVHALAVFDDGTGPALYAAGGFDTADGKTVNRVARWDHEASEWQPVGEGLTGTLYTLGVYDDGDGPALYAGGTFSLVSGMHFNFIARWDGAEWSALRAHPSVPPGVTSWVRALEVFDDGTGSALYLGGNFTKAFNEGPVSITVNRIAKWDGSQWSALGEGFPGTVHALGSFDDGTGPALYVGGTFNSAGGIPADNIARWNGTEWSSVGLPNTFNTTVRATAVFDDGTGPALYVGGNFWDTTGDGSQPNRVARWDGTEWSQVGSGLIGGQVNALTVFDDGSGPALYAGGQFSLSGEGQAVSRIARWDGSQWTPLGTGTNGTVLALAGFDEGSGPALHVGGYYTIAGGQQTNYIATWRGCSIAEPCFGDLNDDGVVDALDLLALLAHWGACNDPEECAGNLNDDGVVDALDLLQLLSAWGSCASDIGDRTTGLDDRALRR